jgi:hypothetical protein
MKNEELREDGAIIRAKTEKSNENYLRKFCKMRKIKPSEREGFMD